VGWLPATGCCSTTKVRGGVKRLPRTRHELCWLLPRECPTEGSWQKLLLDEGVLLDLKGVITGPAALPPLSHSDLIRADRLTLLLELVIGILYEKIYETRVNQAASQAQISSFNKSSSL
jgi:hypothetical protein